ncbi:MAG: hypothetical protein PUD20_03830 [bacterium]|nr:hypothetical protein [bacterium]
MRRLIGFALFFLAIGMLFTLFFDSKVLIVCLIAGLMLCGYYLFCK